MDRGARKQNPQNKNLFPPVASAPTHSTQNIASKPAREQERAARPTRRAGQAERTQGHEAKKELREAKRRAEKIKTRASAWRNKRNKNRKWRQYKDQSNGKTKPDLDYAGVTPLSSRDRAGVMLCGMTHTHIWPPPGL